MAFTPYESSTIVPWLTTKNQASYGALTDQQRSLYDQQWPGYQYNLNNYSPNENPALLNQPNPAMFNIPPLSTPTAAASVPTSSPAQTSNAPAGVDPNLPLITPNYTSPAGAIQEANYGQTNYLSPQSTQTMQQSANNLNAPSSAFNGLFGASPNMFGGLGGFNSTGSSFDNGSINSSGPLNMFQRAGLNGFNTGYNGGY